MKITHLFIAGALMCAFTVAAQVPALPGPAIAGSVTADQLPQKARDLIERTYPDVTIRSINKEFDDGEYDVRLQNGVEMEFDAQGEILEIEADNGKVFTPEILKTLIPGKSYDRLKADGMLRRIEAIKFKKGKAIEVEVIRQRPVDAYIFDWDGNLVVIET